MVFASRCSCCQLRQSVADCCHLSHQLALASHRQHLQLTLNASRNQVRIVGVHAVSAAPSARTGTVCAPFTVSLRRHPLSLRCVSKGFAVYRCRQNVDVVRCKQVLGHAVVCCSQLSSSTRGASERGAACPSLAGLQLISRSKVASKITRVSSKSDPLCRPLNQSVEPRIHSR